MRLRHIHLIGPPAGTTEACRHECRRGSEHSDIILLGDFNDV